MNCAECEKMIVSYWENALTPLQKEEFSLHIQSCEQCARLLCSLKHIDHDFDKESVPFLKEKEIVTFFKEYPFSKPRCVGLQEANTKRKRLFLQYVIISEIIAVLILSLVTIISIAAAYYM